MSRSNFYLAFLLTVIAAPSGQAADFGQAVRNSQRAPLGQSMPQAQGAGAQPNMMSQTLLSQMRQSKASQTPSKPSQTDMQSKAKTAFKRGELSKSERYFLEDIKTAAKPPANSLRLAESLEGLSEVYVKMHRFYDAQVVLNESLKILERKYGRTSPNLISPCLQLASAYMHSATDQTRQAKDVLSRVVFLINQNKGEGLSKLNSTLVAFSKSKVLIDKLPALESCYAQAYEAGSHWYGAESQLALECLHSMGKYNLALGKAERASAVLAKAYELGPEISSFNASSEYVEIAATTAQAYFECKQYGKAKQIALQVVQLSGKLKNKVLQDRGLGIAAMSCLAQNSSNEASLLFKRRLELEEELYGKEDRRIEDTLAKFLEALIACNNWSEAQAIGLRLSQSQLERLGPCHSEIGDTFAALCLIELKLGHKDSSNRYCKEACIQWQNSMQAEPIEYAQHLEQLAQKLALAKDFDRAGSLVLLALEAKEVLYKGRSKADCEFGLAKLLVELGDFQALGGNLNLAKDSYIRALELERAVDPQFKTNMAQMIHAKHTACLKKLGMHGFL